MTNPDHNSTARTPNRSTKIPVPLFAGKPILDGKSRPAFRVATLDIIESIRQQFPDRRLAFRELGQNSADANAAHIRINMRHEDECMVADFIDDGFGMTRDIIEKNYLTLFDSTKENKEGCIGYYSLGRISAFVFPLESLELFTLSAGTAGYHLEIRSDYSGRLFEVEAGDMAKFLDSEHGTLVRLRYPVGDAAAFVAEVESINQSLRQELCWLNPEVKTTTCTLEEDTLKFGTQIINTPFAVPGRLSHTIDVRLASQLGAATVALGVEGEDARTSKGDFQKLETGLSPATVCIGKIPVLRASELPWTGRKPFAIQNLRVVIDSFQFKTNIGRNVVYLDQPFPGELLPKVFKNLILGRYLPALAKAFNSKTGAISHNLALRNLLLDTCAQSPLNNYKIPDELLDAPLLPALYRHRDYSIREVDATGSETLFITYQKKQIDHRLDDDDGEGLAICISLHEQPYAIRKWLEGRYADRIVFKTTDLLPIDEDTPEARRTANRIHDSLALRTMLQSRDIQKLTSSDCEFATTITCGRLRRFDGGTDTRTPAHVFESTRRVVLNLDNPHIRRLLDLMTGATHSLAAHFIFREVLFATGQKLPVAHREQLLTRDLKRRFGTKTEGARTIEDIIESLGLEIEPF